jgi:hypothetical protein
LFGANFVWGRFDLLPIKSCDTSPGISDHYAIVIDSNLKPSYNKPKRRNINLFKKANWKNIKEEIAKIGSTIINSTKSLEEKWTDLTDGINNALNTNVPSKQTSRRHGLLQKINYSSRRKTGYSNKQNKLRKKKTGQNIET